MNPLRLAFPLVAIALVAACGSVYSVGKDRSAETDVDGGDGSAPPVESTGCTKDTDCGAGFVCGFPKSEACAATGACFAVGAVAICNAYLPGCACDGTEINVICQPMGDGYTSKPLLHEGRCNATDAGGGGACTRNSDCADGFACGYPEADGCSAKGTCFDTRGIGVCGAFIAGCACDGSEINVICQPYPNGYVAKPFLHAGACSDAGR
jgi:hypothetical protein